MPLVLLCILISRLFTSSECYGMVLKDAGIKKNKMPVSVSYVIEVIKISLSIVKM